MASKVLVIGAYGRVAQHIVRKLKADPAFEPVAFFRNPDHKAFFDELGVNSVVGDVTAKKEVLQDAMAGCSAVIWSAGNGGKGGSDMTIGIDLDGAVKSMEAAYEAGVKRYIMVSATQADDRSVWESLPDLKTYYMCKHYADTTLRHKFGMLDYTILRPGPLSDGHGTGKVSTAVPKDSPSISREDVATAVLCCLNDQATFGKTIELHPGDVAIAEAVQNVESGSAKCPASN
mmetsp:Transcript_13506/g.29541  ORF Transcript_13506/g.29541 Transcript_13506/m.29541 type:complete len:232 (+) Transcript_13506:3213-3908(+)